MSSSPDYWDGIPHSIPATLSFDRQCDSGFLLVRRDKRHRAHDLGVFVILVEVRRYNTLLSQYGEPRWISRKHLLWNPVIEILRYAEDRAHHEKMHTGAQSLHHAIVCAVPGAAVKDDQRTCRCLSWHNSTTALPYHRLVANGVATPLVATRHKRGATVYPIEIG